MFALNNYYFVCRIELFLSLKLVLFIMVWNLWDTLEVGCMSCNMIKSDFILHIII